MEDAKLRAKKDALQKALAEAIYACTGTTVDPSSLNITDEDVSLPEGVDNVFANADKLKRTYIYTASDGKQYPLLTNLPTTIHGTISPVSATMS